MHTDTKFQFYNPGRLVDEDLELILTDEYRGDPVRGLVPAYKFDMTLTGRGTPVGRTDLRIGNVRRIVMYGGHIGYEVFPKYRGHHYAARSVRLLLSLARRHGLKTLWITCNPDNYASRRTCELAGFKFVEIVDLPPDNDMYLQGERQKCRYRLDL
jgi:predicted acetyltransferase